ncbi:putative unfolded protein binding protein [Trypoxylus dichotomus]
MEVMEEAPLHQSYRAGRSTEIALLELTGIIQKTLDEGETAICAFLDISDALDNTSHEAVRQALEKRGASKRVTRWLSSPQGQLSLVVDELVNRLTAFGVHYKGYADDIAIITKGRFEGILCELIQMRLRITNEWCHSVGLSINSSKTTIVPFTRKRTISNTKDIRLDGTLIECKSEVKYVGITLYLD